MKTELSKQSISNKGVAFIKDNRNGITAAAVTVAVIGSGLVVKYLVTEAVNSRNLRNQNQPKSAEQTLDLAGSSNDTLESLPASVDSSASVVSESVGEEPVGANQHQSIVDQINGELKKYDGLVIHHREGKKITEVGYRCPVGKAKKDLEVYQIEVLEGDKLQWMYRIPTSHPEALILVAMVSRISGQRHTTLMVAGKITE